MEPAWPTSRRGAAGAAMCTSQTGGRRRCLRAGPAGSVRTPTTMRRTTFWCGRDCRACPFRPGGQGRLHGEGRSRGGPRRPVNETGRLSSPAHKSHTQGQGFECEASAPSSKTPPSLSAGMSGTGPMPLSRSMPLSAEWRHRAGTADCGSRLRVGYHVQPAPSAHRKWARPSRTPSGDTDVPEPEVRCEMRDPRMEPRQ